MIEVVLCREMKWTWQEYLDQPVWLIQHLYWYMVQESAHAKKKK